VIKFIKGLDVDDIVGVAGLTILAGMVIIGGADTIAEWLFILGVNI